MNVLKDTCRGLALLGCDLIAFGRAVRGIGPFLRDRREFLRQSRKVQQTFNRGRTVPCLRDRYEQAGGKVGQYFYQDLLVAQRVLADNPKKHVDVGSSVGGFVSHVAVFREIEVLDIRPLEVHTPNIRFRQMNIMDLASVPVDYCDSVSCLHVLEHFGLGRYGDPVQYDGHLKGLEGLHRLLTPNGKLYLSVPIGPQRVEFNAHRVFAVQYLLEMLRGRFDVLSFSYIDDNDLVHANIKVYSKDVEQNFGCCFGCGIFELRRM